MSGRHGGHLVEWIEADGFGEVQPSGGGMGRLVVYREELVRAGMMPPKIGDMVTFEVGVTRTGVTGAINVERVPAARLEVVR
jgi:hypothetical protein